MDKKKQGKCAGCAKPRTKCSCLDWTDNFFREVFGLNNNPKNRKDK